MTDVTTIQRLLRVEQSTAFGAALLVVANSVPLAGVLFFGWSAATILILYWLENGVVGIFNVLRIARVQAASPHTTMTLRVRSSWSDPSVRTGRYFIPTFIANYGLFWLVHGFFVLVLVGFTTADGQFPVSLVGLLVGVICLAISQAGEYRTFVRRREYQHVTPQVQMMAPYGRLLVLHFTILIGAFLVLLTGQPVVLVAALVALKIGLDLVLFLRAHRGVAPVVAR